MLSHLVSSKKCILQPLLKLRMTNLVKTYTKGIKEIGNIQESANNFMNLIMRILIISIIIDSAYINMIEFIF